MVTRSRYTDTNVLRGSTCYYTVTALDLGGPESDMSAEVQSTGRGNAAASLVWINELHYDNFQTDTGEFVEIAGPADLKLDNWRLVVYNGLDGTVYGSSLLFGTIPHQQGCLGTLAFDFTGLQNGAPDGDCADGVACTLDSCDEDLDACEHTPDDAACDDRVWCNGAERCDSTLDCQAGADPCSGLFCLEADQACVQFLTDEDCGPGLTCTKEGTFQAASDAGCGCQTRGGRQLAWPLLLAVILARLRRCSKAGAAGLRAGEGVEVRRFHSR